LSYCQFLKNRNTAVKRHFQYIYEKHDLDGIVNVVQKNKITEVHTTGGTKVNLSVFSFKSSATESCARHRLRISHMSTTHKQFKMADVVDTRIKQRFLI
jgi:2-iminoacetate synthase ThiH